MRWIYIYISKPYIHNLPRKVVYGRFWKAEFSRYTRCGRLNLIRHAATLSIYLHTYNNMMRRIFQLYGKLEFLSLYHSRVLSLGTVAPRELRNAPNIPIYTCSYTRNHRNFQVSGYIFTWNPNPTLLIVRPMLRCILQRPWINRREIFL